MEKKCKKDILEIIDDENNLIGSDAIPKNGKNVETMANGTSDANAKKGHQEFDNDFLGRFGFYFYENKSINNELVENIKNKKIESEFVGKTEKELIKREKLTKVADLLNKLSDDDVKELVNILIEKNNE